MIDIELPSQIQQGLSILNILIMGLFFGIVLTHVISKFFMVKTPIKLKVNSFVVVTGGCMGIGKQMALEIAKLYHCSIMIVDIKRDLFQDVNCQITKLGSICQCYYCDLSNDQSVDQFISNLNQRNHKIDLFIHNAGIIIPKKVLESSHKQIMLQMKVNFLSPVKIIKQTISLMEGGHIAVIASMVTLAQGGVEVSSYSASKYALNSFLTCFRQQLKQSKRNISLSIGCPYAIKTTMFTGFKTKLDFLFRWLDQTYVAKRLVKQFVQKRQVCYIYQYQALLFKIVGFLPSGFSDLFSIACNVSDFSSIKDKHKQLSQKKQNKN